VGLLQKWEAEGELSAAIRQQFETFVDLLIEWNHRLNLTGLTTRNEIEDVLIGESILAITAFPLGGKRVLDFGSGAGIPGLIWAIYDPSIELTSLEIRAKKIAFQKEVARRTRISAEILRGRFPEDVSERVFDVIATRAIRFSSELWSDARSLLSDGGSMLRFANPDVVDAGWEAIKLSVRSTLLVARK
jgi:16S rRNA (guanine527-N7)-methyltransferase